MPTGSSAWQTVLAVFKKEMACEWRRKQSLVGLGLFSLSTLGVLGLSLGQDLSGPASGLLIWVLFFFAVNSGLEPAFRREEDRGTEILLRLAIHPWAVFMGKAMAGMVWLGGLALLVTPVYHGLLSLSTPLLPLLSLAVVGMLGLVAASTAVSALAAQVPERGPLMVILSLPLTMPGLLGATQVTRSLLEGGGWGEVSRGMVFLAAFAGAMLIAGAGIYQWIQE